MPTAAYIHIPFCRRRCYYCDFPISVVGDVPPMSRQQNHQKTDGSPLKSPSYGAGASRQSATMQSTTIQPEPSAAIRSSEIKSERQSGDGKAESSTSTVMDGHGSGAIAQYLNWLEQEIEVTGASTETKQQPLATVFLGGGTPSLLSVEQLGRILNVLQQQFGIQSAAEISIEMDPGTFSLQQVQGYAQRGINRVSLGVQAFQPQILEACGRTHAPQDILQAVDWIHQAGITNFSLDLISGLPHQSMEQWEESLERAIALNPTHLSVYDLTVEPMTAFGRWYQPGAKPLPTDDETAEMYRRAQTRLTQAGYLHYEISNYAKPGFQCRHNQVYWRNQPYYGFGLGATSYVNQMRYSRPRTQADYRQWVQTLATRRGKLDAASASPEDSLLDTLMVGLRLAEGLALTTLTQQFGDRTVYRLLKLLQPYQKKRWVQVVRASTTTEVQLTREFLSEVRHESAESLFDDPLDDLHLKLTDPEGFLFSNVVLSQIFAEF